MLEVLVKICCDGPIMGPYKPCSRIEQVYTDINDEGRIEDPNAPAGWGTEPSRSFHDCYYGPRYYCPEHVAEARKLGRCR